MFKIFKEFKNFCFGTFIIMTCFGALSSLTRKELAIIISVVAIFIILHEIRNRINESRGAKKIMEG